MFIKKTSRTVKGKTYINHLLVESVSTPNGPRHRIICSLGNLAPAPREEWLVLARKIESSLSGQIDLEGDEKVAGIVRKVRALRKKEEPVMQPGSEEVVSVHTDLVNTEDHREAGPAHVGHQMWKKLGVDEVLAEAGISERGRMLTEVMTLNRLVHPGSEHAMPDWVRRTAVAEIVGEDFTDLSDNALYLNLDRLHPHRGKIERGLAEKERTLFALDESIYLYDLTSTYFEGTCKRNPQAQRGYSRDSRPDCKQVVVGLVLDKEGFPKGHEVFDGNRNDKTTVEDMLQSLEKRMGRRKGTTVVVDRGMAYDDNLETIKEHGYHYIVASRQKERDAHLDEYEDEGGWEEILRTPSPMNPSQKKSRVWVKRSMANGEVHILCKSDGREEKDRAIREKQERRLLIDLEKLKRRVETGKLRGENKVHEVIGRLKERYPRVARYYAIRYDKQTHTLNWEENAEKKEKARELDGGYLLKTDRTDLGEEDIWRVYILLTRVESAFRAMKSPLMERPIFHHLEHRVQAHIFLCVLAYHLLVSIEKMCLDKGVHTSWAALRDQLSTHQVVTVVLPTTDKGVLKIRKGGKPEEVHREIYRLLEIPEEVMRPVKTWYRS